MKKQLQSKIKALEATIKELIDTKAMKGNNGVAVFTWFDDHCCYLMMKGRLDAFKEILKLVK